MAVKKKRVIRSPSGRNGYVLPQAKLEQPRPQLGRFFTALPLSDYDNSRADEHV